ncbi:MAG: universal stress protein [Halobacteriota archaeon]
MCADVTGERGSLTDSRAVGRSCLLAPIRDESIRPRATAVCHALAAERDVDLTVADESVTDIATSIGPSARVNPDEVSVHDAPSVNGGIDTLADRCYATAVIMERRAHFGPLDDLLGTPAANVSTNSSVDVLTVGDRGAFDALASILVPVTDGPNSPLAVETGVALARAYDAALDLFHVETPAESSTDGEAILARTVESIDNKSELKIDTWLYEAQDVAAAIIKQSEYYDLTVMGAPTSGRLQRFVFGSTSKAVQKGAVSPVIVAHSGSA